MHATGKLKNVEAHNARAARNANLTQRTSMARRKFPSKSPVLYNSSMSPLSKFIVPIPKYFGGGSYRLKIEILRMPLSSIK